MTQVKTLANETWLQNLRREPTGRIVVLLSGGIDSAAVALMLRDAGHTVLPLFLEYGQAALEAEREAASRFVAAAALPELRVLPCPVYSELKGLLPARAETDTDAWVPARNTLFMLLAGIYAHGADADGIALGTMLDDNFVFGDNDFFHHKTLELLLSRSFLRPFDVLLPALRSGKADLVGLLSERGLLRHTVSCWNARLVGGELVECGACANCREKAAVLGAVGLQ